MAVDRISSQTPFVLTLVAPVEPNGAGEIVLTPADVSTPASADPTLNSLTVTGNATVSGDLTVSGGSFYVSGSLTQIENVEVSGAAKFSGVQEFGSNADAITGGLAPGDIYRTPVGVAMIVFTP